MTGGQHTADIGSAPSIEDLPTGDVTLVFTDIEGSTKLLHELGDRYVDLLNEHNARIRRAVARHDGREVKFEGDGFLFAFVSARQAMSASLDMHLTLSRGGWPHGRIPRVRVGVHRGDVELIDNADYVGLAVHEAARLADAGHGGQLLVTDSVLAENDDLPPGASLLDLGTHRLRDFPRSRRVFQLCHPDLPRNFPALRTVEARSSLPAPPTPIVGRADVLLTVENLLAGSARLVTLTGPGGIGKTRLAVEASWQMLALFPGGARFVDLSHVSDASDVLRTVRTAVGASDDSDDHVAAIAAALGPDPSLLVLDNLEQVIQCAVDVAAVLETAPNLRVLATSRERLRIRAENEIVLGALDDTEATELFMARAAAAGVDTSTFVPDDIAAICAHLAGHPLAIELAAPALRLFTPSVLLAQLRASLDAYEHGPVDLPERQRALRATIQWSWDLLDEDQQRTLAFLSAAAGSASIDLARALTAAAGVPSEADGSIAALATKSLVHLLDGPEERRVEMLESIQRFAWERLVADGSDGVAVAAHAAWCLDLAQRAERHARTAEAKTWNDQLDLERDNIRSALERGRSDLTARLADSLSAWWTTRGHWSDARRWLSVALDRADDPKLRARLLVSSAYFAERQGDHRSARTYGEAGLDAARQLGDRALEARVLVILGDVERNAGDRGESRALFESAHEIATKTDDDLNAAVALSNLGLWAWEDGSNDEALAFWEEALRLQQDRLREPRAIAILHGNLGLVHRAQGDLEQAEASFHRALELSREIADPLPAADALLNLGTVAKDRGDEAAARARYLEALDAYEKLGHRRSTGLALLHLSMATDSPADARRWANAALESVSAAGDVRSAEQCERVLAAIDELEGTDPQ